MKRSKLFLGATTALLAIAGVAAAKHYSGAKAFFYVTHNQTWCTTAGTVPCTQSGSVNCLYTTTGPLAKKVATFTVGPRGTYNPNQPTNCLSQIKYNSTN